MFNMIKVWVWAKMWCLEVFKVRSSCYVTRLVLEHTVWCSRTVRFFVMFYMFEVRFWAKMWCSEVFEVRSCCYVTRLVLELTVWCSRTVRVFVMFDMFEVRFWAKMWCSESSMFGHSMFGVFEVRYFGVRSKTNLWLYAYIKLKISQLQFCNTSGALLIQNGHSTCGFAILSDTVTLFSGYV